LPKTWDVKFYFKLPRCFKIDTPIGAYNPDWAVVFEADRRIYLVAETKGTEIVLRVIGAIRPRTV
jgi:type III restriction enzyme